MSEVRLGIRALAGTLPPAPDPDVESWGGASGRTCGSRTAGGHHGRAQDSVAGGSTWAVVPVSGDGEGRRTLSWVVAPVRSSSSARGRPGTSATELPARLSLAELVRPSPR
ncbi:hypothetical protein LV779_24775 [Streptomyces thinghirensis]|nr:hypothetical protein [Streptomyces thinghirensis]